MSLVHPGIDPTGCRWRHHGQLYHCLLELSQTIFDCSDLVRIRSSYFATDQSGNQGECSSNVRVYDLLPPVFTVVPEDVTALLR